MINVVSKRDGTSSVLSMPSLSAIKKNNTQSLPHNVSVSVLTKLII